MTSLLGGRYRLLGRIAAGGMGEVWRAADELLGREVAVKLLHRHVAADPAFRGRFRTEARIAAGLADPGIAQVYDYGEADDDAYLVMELVPGESLAAILARTGPLAPDDALDVVQQTARALHAAHGAGIIHRDIKPGNLLVTATGTVKITDFGIARAMEAAPVTQTGTVLGTAQYVSPEQASGTALTPATDLYSLGVVAYECLAGRPPFTAENQVAIALMHLNEEPPPLPGSVPAPVRELVMACLAKDPAHRPADALELAERARALRGSPTGAGTAGLGTLTDPAGWRAGPSTAPVAPAAGPATLRGPAGAPAPGTGPGRNRASPAAG
ncbi:protein kinase domain-containing protein, partial [Planomonospora alba]|uniref:protein kinase domain-containing protein n=1 Tax=Planomonospora alba TaxID=161354 RepID=UPI0031EDC296